jgi:hypothetical protein
MGTSTWPKSAYHPAPYTKLPEGELCLLVLRGCFFKDLKAAFGSRLQLLQYRARFRHDCATSNGNIYWRWPEYQEMGQRANV